ncbi:MAG: sterol desaturase family protein [Bacteroidota bacterium]
MQLFDFTFPLVWFYVTLALSLIIFLRYVLVSGLFYVIFYRYRKSKSWIRKLNPKWPPAGQARKEIFWSGISSIIFALAGTAMVFAWQSGLTQIYLSLTISGIPYFILSIITALLFHETYYYWLHRWMHRPKVFRILHKVHHDSLITSPWTSFSFHPLETILQAIVVPIIVFILPMHYLALLIMLTIMTVSAVINHLDIEIYPKGFEQHWLGKWLIGATHHSLHHTEFRTNYGLYFTFWDKWMDTESEQYHERLSNKEP